MNEIKEYNMGGDNPLLHISEDINELRFMLNGEYKAIIDLNIITDEVLDKLISKLKEVRRR